MKTRREFLGDALALPVAILGGQAIAFNAGGRLATPFDNQVIVRVSDRLLYGHVIGTGRFIAEFEQVIHSPAVRKTHKEKP